MTFLAPDSVPRVKKAQVMLRNAGFSDAERQAVIHAAVVNRFDPIHFAQSAIRLRRHVEEGNPV